MKRTIVIGGIESTEKQIIILVPTGEAYANGDKKQDKYKIWIKDQKGEISKAYNQYQKIRPLAGDIFEVEVFEKDTSFVGRKGETINYVDKTINEFVLDTQGNPVKPSEAQNSPIPIAQPQQTQTPTPQQNGALEERIRVSFLARDKAIEELATMVIDLKEKVARYETLLVQTKGTEAVELHGSMKGDEHLSKEETEKFEDEATKKLGL